METTGTLNDAGIKKDTEKITTQMQALSMDIIMEDAPPLPPLNNEQSQQDLQKIEKRKEKTDLMIRGRRGMKYAEKNKRSVKPIGVEEVKNLVKREMELHANDKSEFIDTPDPLLLEFESRQRKMDEAEAEIGDDDEDNTNVEDYCDVNEVLNYREDVDYSKKDVWRGPEEMLHFIPEEYK